MENKNIMGYKPIFPLLISMALPPMISMLIQSLYNIVDSIFVAKIGEEAITAISLIYPLQNLSLAISCGIGIAMNAFIARYLGSQDTQKASHIATQGLVMSFLHSLLFVIIGLFLIGPFINLFTNNTTVAQYSIEYGTIVITLTFGSFIHIAIEKIFQATGNMLIPMIMQIVGAVVNVILDPIFIFGYFGLPSLGVSGAAIATIIGQFTACIISILFFKKYNHHIHISFKNFHFDAHVFKNLYSIAILSGVMMCLPSILVSILNAILSTISQTSVAFFGIYYKLQTFIFMPAAGIIQGMRPILSYNYGAKEKIRMNQTIKVSLLCISSIFLCGTLYFFCFPQSLLSLFDANDTMLKMGMTGLRILSLSFILSSFGILMSGVFESLGLGKYSLIISLLRQFLIIIPLSLILLPNFGINSVWMTFPIAELIASLFAFYFYLKKYKCIMFQ